MTVRFLAKRYFLKSLRNGRLNRSLMKWLDILVLAFMIRGISRVSVGARFFFRQDNTNPVDQT